MIDASLNYSSLEPISLDQAKIEIQSGVGSRAGVALLRLALHDPNWKMVHTLCMKYMESDDVELRRLATLGIGHIARLHRDIINDSALFTSTVSVLLNNVCGSDGTVFSAADEALASVQVFCVPEKYCREYWERIITQDLTPQKVIGITDIARRDSSLQYAMDVCVVFCEDPNFMVRGVAIMGLAWILTRDDYDGSGTEFSAVAKRELASSNCWVRGKAETLDETIRLLAQ